MVLVRPTINFCKLLHFHCCKTEVKIRQICKQLSKFPDFLNVSFDFYGSKYKKKYLTIPM